MKNPINVYVSDKVKNGDAELVKFTGFIAHVDTSNENRIRLCFRADTSDKDSGLVSVTAWKNSDGKGPDWEKILSDAKGRWAVVTAVHTSSNGYDNYTLNTIDMAPRVDMSKK